jgi:predicted MPP superfamily phosphohydrolase
MAVLGAAYRRWRGYQRIAACSAVLIFEALVLASYLSSFSSRFATFHGMRLGSAAGVAALIYLVTSASMVAVYLTLRPVWSHLNAATDPGRRRALGVAGNALLCSPIAAISYGSLIQRTGFEVREIDMPMSGLSADLDGLRILQISDIHLSPFLSEKELARVVDATLSLHPHIAFITGDLISSRRDPLDACICQLARVKAEAGVFGCLGNHEHYAGAEDAATKKAARVGIRFLRSQSQALRFGSSVLNIAGVDYQLSRNRNHYLRGEEHLVTPGAFNLLLSHNPDVFPFAARQGYDLVLAGHTHGGQVNIEIFGASINPARFYTPYVYGLYRHGRSVEYVTRGVGTIGVPVRLGAPPEVALLRLRKT